MRSSRKNSQIFSWLLATALSLGSAAPAFAQLGAVKCDYTDDDLKPHYHGEAKTHCNPANEEAPCSGVLQRIDLYSGQMRGFKDDTCKYVKDAEQRLPTLQAGDTYFDAQINLYENVLNRYDTYGRALNEAYGRMRQGMEPVLQPPPPGTTETPDHTRDRTQVAAEIKDPAKLAKNRTIPARTEKPSDITGDVHKRRFAMNNGVNFMKELMKEQKETDDAKRSLNADLDNLRKARARLVNVQPPTNGPAPAGGTSPPASGSGFNPTALMGLATAAAGLAGMMNKQAADSGAPAATSPTPESLNPPTASAPPAHSVSKLDNGKSGPPQVGASPKAADPEAPVASANVPGGKGFGEESDISNSTPAPPNHAAPATSKATGGGGGGGGGGGDAPVPAARDLAGLGHEGKEEEAMQGIGGGGLGGGGSAGLGSSSPPSDPAVAAAEESMKDLLTDMKETAEGSDPSAALGEVQADGSIMAMDAEDLFPRVRAAHVRCLKQGRVLNGLGEKITPDSENQ